jgi:hypothetical protein
MLVYNSIIETSNLNLRVLDPRHPRRVRTKGVFIPRGKGISTTPFEKDTIHFRTAVFGNVFSDATVRENKIGLLSNFTIL